jgi:hypothetical protein
VIAKLSRDTAAVCRNLPPSTAWVAFGHFEDLHGAIAAVLGPSGPRRIAREGTMSGPVPLLRPVFAGMMRLFGGTPHTIYARLGEVMTYMTRGTEYVYRKTGDTSCRMRVAFPHRRNLSDPTFESLAGALEVGLSICNVRGTVSTAIVVPDGSRNAAEYAIAW